MNKTKEIDLTNEDQAYWNKILVEEGFGMSRGSLGEPNERDAVLEYLETYSKQIVPSTELPKGFSTSDELTQQYEKEILEEIN